MKKLSIFSVALLAVFILAQPLFCRNVTRVVEGINAKQPILHGELVYEDTVKVWHGSSYSYYNVKYTYVGFQDDAIKVRHEYEVDDLSTSNGVRKSKSILTLPLDKYDRTFLRMHKIPRWPKETIIPDKRLDIVLNDRNNFAISVEEFSKAR